MIHYDLRCAEGHEFDGWFHSSTAFDQQATAGFLDCPVCASTIVSRAIMAPRLSFGAAPPPGEAKGPAPEAPPAESADMSVNTGSMPGGSQVLATPSAPALPVMPDGVRAVLQRLRAEVEKRCDYVGERFAAEARAMHHGEQPHRPIYGETTPDQAKRLSDEGIEVARIPWVPRADG
jgi:hypothetical protein